MKYLEVTIPIRGFKTTYMYWTYPRVTGKNWCYVNIYSFLNDVLKNFYNDSTCIFLLQYLIRPIICISRLMSRSSFYFFVSPPSHPQYYEIIMNNIYYLTDLILRNIKNNFLSINYRDKEGTVFSLELRKRTDWLFTNSIFFDPNK